MRLGTARTNPTDFTFEYNSLCIIFICTEIGGRNVRQRETFIYITFQNLYFITFT